MSHFSDASLAKKRKLEYTIILYNSFYIYGIVCRLKGENGEWGKLNGNITGELRKDLNTIFQNAPICHQELKAQ